MLERRVSERGVVWYASPVLTAAGVGHAFSTRVGGAGDEGGASPAPFDSFNLGNPGGCAVQDARERIVAHERVLQEVAGCRGREFCRVHQVHGGAIAVAARGRAFDSGTKADALVTDDPRRSVSVRTADCVPVLIASGDGRVVAAVHAGWRGVVEGVVGKAVGAMVEVWSAAGSTGCPPRAAGEPVARESVARVNLCVAVGPCIGVEAFEVGQEVIAAFAGALPAEVISAVVRRPRRGDGKRNIDLRGAVRWQLEAAGVAPGSIDVSDRCTWRDRDEFFSHRRDAGVTGRMASVVSPRG